MQIGAIVRGTVCVIGAVTLLALAIVTVVVAVVARFPMGEDVIVKSYPSPTAAMTAIVETRVGGGAFSPYCVSRIFVIDGKIGIKKLPEAGDTIFSGDCDALAEGDFAGAGPSLPVRWDSDAVLRIPIRRDGTPITLRGRDRTGRVAIAFVFEDPSSRAASAAARR
ncbi:hypothetical protein ACQVP2_20010 [Methylobacterium aquaticum]|uniref:hypothetical protein n=1 Tax=Methylobacterium aquaticum TaxID=270351 RepID=UPI003D179633